MTYSNNSSRSYNSWTRLHQYSRRITRSVVPARSSLSATSKPLTQQRNLTARSMMGDADFAVFTRTEFFSRSCCRCCCFFFWATLFVCYAAAVLRAALLLLPWRSAARSAECSNSGTIIYEIYDTYLHGTSILVVILVVHQYKPVST